jgi:hypothetical protein
MLYAMLAYIFHDSRYGRRGNDHYGEVCRGRDILDTFINGLPVQGASHGIHQIDALPPTMVLQEKRDAVTEARRPARARYNDSFWLKKII